MSDVIGPPSLFNQMLEGRAGFEAAALLAQLPVLRIGLPRGRGPVLVLPGFMADDGSTWLLRRFIAGLGYQVEGWGLGINRGPLLDLLPRVLSNLQDRGPWRLVGWSRGGVLAREIARDHPELVRSLITLGTPVQGGPAATSIGRSLRRQIGLSPAQLQALLRERARRPIEPPMDIVYSKTDGIVSWQACLDRRSPNVRHHEIDVSHIGMGFHAGVYRVVARALAKPVDRGY